MEGAEFTYRAGGVPHRGLGARDDDARARLRQTATDVATFAALVAFGLFPVAVMFAYAAPRGLVFAGSDGAFPLDQFQYMAWTREYAAHLLASNTLDVAPSSHVFLHPMFVLSGLALRAGLSVQAATLLWKPVGLLVMFLGFRAYAYRFVSGSWARWAAIAVGLFFASPVAPIMSWASIGPVTLRGDVFDASGEILPAVLQWGYAPGAIAVGLTPVFLLLAERLVRGDGPARRRDVALTAACGAAIAWIHPWQGEIVLVAIVALALLGRLSRRYLPLAVPALATGLPLAYYFGLSRLDPSWSFASRAHADRGELPVLGVAIALAPLLAVAVLGLRGRARDAGERILLLWPLAGLAVYLGLAGSVPKHALEGLCLPLAVLAALALQRLRWQPAVAVAFVAVMCAPGVVNMVDWMSGTLDATSGLLYIQPDEQRALAYLAHEPGRGGVLAGAHLSGLVPAATGRPTWVGHSKWTHGFDTRRHDADLLVTGHFSRARAIALVRGSGAAFLLADCGDSRAALDALRPVVTPLRTVGCAAVYRING